VLGQARNSQRYAAKPATDEELRLALVRLAKQYGRYGYRKIAALLRVEGFAVNHKKVERLWREEGLQLPTRHKKRKRLYDNASSCIRLRALYPNHIWSYDFVADKLQSGRPYRMLTLIDEYTREALIVRVALRLSSQEVIAALAETFLRQGKPAHIRSDNGSEFTSTEIRKFLHNTGVKPLYILPGSPWENGFNERFNGTLRREILNAEHFHNLGEAQAVIAAWQHQYNTIRPHSALNYRPPAPETTTPPL